MADLTLTLTNEAETARFSQKLAHNLHAGSVVLLKGQIGAGKSFLCRAMIQELVGENTDVPSPTFTLVQTYDAPEFEIWHCDLYRLTTPEHVDELGLFDAFETAVCLIEWPERLGGNTPNNALIINFSVDTETNHRTINLTGPDHIWGNILESVDATHL